MSQWKCNLCQYEENEEEDGVCVSCDEGVKPSGGGQAKPLIIVALAKTISPVPGKDKLRAVTLDIGSGKDITVVTNATLYASTLVCVALPGATVPCDGEEVTVKEAKVGGVLSAGMLCDCPMLGWKGGAQGLAATIPDKAGLKPGDAVPAARPRGDQGSE